MNRNKGILLVSVDKFIKFLRLAEDIIYNNIEFDYTSGNLEVVISSDSLPTTCNGANYPYLSIESISIDKDLKLCYIDNCFAYFTTQDLKVQCGDDWDDAPYEHNAGAPYLPKESEDYKIVKVAFESSAYTPDSEHLNSPYSVDDINDKVVPWLKYKDYKTNEFKVLFAGATLTEFINYIEDGGGTIYLER